MYVTAMVTRSAATIIEKLKARKLKQSDKKAGVSQYSGYKMLLHISIINVKFIMHICELF